MTFSDGALPVPIKDFSSVPYDNTFLIVGGINFDTNEYIDRVLQFDVTDETFKFVPNARLNRNFGRPAAMLVDVMAFPEC